MQSLTDDLILRAPKALLHDHLDGGLRPATIIELADEIGHELPSTDEAGLGEWFHLGAARRDLPLYLETFAHTVAVLQTPAALHRVAREADHAMREIEDADRLAHVEHEHLTPLGQRARLQHEL